MDQKTPGDVTYGFLWEGRTRQGMRGKGRDGYFTSPLLLSDGSSDGHVTLGYCVRGGRESRMYLHFVRFLGPSKTNIGCTEWEYESVDFMNDTLETERRSSLPGEMPSEGRLKVLPAYIGGMASSFPEAPGRIVLSRFERMLLGGDALGGQSCDRK
jgi:hypothetical protein